MSLVGESSVEARMILESMGTVMSQVAQQMTKNQETQEKLVQWLAGGGGPGGGEVGKGP